MLFLKCFCNLNVHWIVQTLGARGQRLFISLGLGSTSTTKCPQFWKVRFERTTSHPSGTLHDVVAAATSEVPASSYLGWTGNNVKAAGGT